MPELQDILNQYGKQYKQNHNLPIYVSKTLKQHSLMNHYSFSLKKKDE